jgi:glucosamine 6-phosphate synthetase-like amidotransferase/phosphosugar isomerase protein
MKHGPNALIDEKLPVVVSRTILAAESRLLCNASNIQEVKAREGIVIAVVTEGDHEPPGSPTTPSGAGFVRAAAHSRSCPAVAGVSHCRAPRLRRGPAAQLAKSVTVE